MRLLLTSGALAALCYLVVLGLLYSQQRRLLYPASQQRVSAREAGLAEFEDVEITTSDGERLVGWWKPPGPGRAIVLYFHGNGGSLIERRDRVRALGQNGRGVLIVSYRGYSGATGSPSEDGIRKDALAAWSRLSSYDPGRIVIYGESLGTGAAVGLAAGREIGGLVLDSPFTSIADVARPNFWFVPVDLLLRDQFRSIDRIGELRAPLLILHGEEDRIVPIALGERLFAAAPEPKRFVGLPGVDHVSVLESGGYPIVGAFLGEVETRLGRTPASSAVEGETARDPR